MLVDLKLLPQQIIMQHLKNLLSHNDGNQQPGNDTNTFPTDPEFDEDSHDDLDVSGKVNLLKPASLSLLPPPTRLALFLTLSSLTHAHILLAGVFKIYIVSIVPLTGPNML